MDETAKETVSRLIEILAGRTPISRATEILAPDVVSHIDGYTFRGIRTWARWLAYVRVRSRVGNPDLETDRLVTHPDGTITARGRWKGIRNGEPVFSGEVWARYRVADGRVVEIWTHRDNYVFLLGPIMRTPAGLLLTMLRVFLWSRTSGGPDLPTGPAGSTGSSHRTTP